MIQYIAAGLALVVLHVMITVAIRRFDWVKENFRKDRIPAVFGLYIVAWGAVACMLARYSEGGSDLAARQYLVAILGFGLLGLADDVFGSREVGGFKGHFKKLLFERKLTTGAAKALGGGGIALYLGWRTSGGVAWMWALDTMAIGLAANTINLLDLRPGRAIFAFFVGMIAVVIAGWAGLSAPVVLGGVAIAAAGVAYFDSTGRAMLGDVGSNALGAVLGLTIALDTTTAFKAAVVVVFLVINAYSERRSISKLIAGNRVLSYFDSKLGVR